MRGRRYGHGPRPGEIAPVVPELRAGHTVLAVDVPAADGEVAGSDPDDRYGFGEAGGLVAVRPDGYIGLLTAGTDRAPIGAYLSTVG